jgi:dephospho-CoA kinase
MKNDKLLDGVSIIAVVGPIAAGKGTAADLLIAQGYAPFNYGDVIYRERTALGLKEERRISNAVGAGLRSEFGNDIIARRLAESIEEFLEQKQSQKILIDGLRHPDEVTWVKENLQAQVIGVTASPEVRYERTLKRGRVVDPESREEFTEVDHEDRGIGSKTHENQSDSCVLLADIVIENNTDDLEIYKRKISEGIQHLTGSYINKEEVA